MLTDAHFISHLTLCNATTSTTQGHDDDQQRYKNSIGKENMSWLRITYLRAHCFSLIYLIPFRLFFFSPRQPKHFLFISFVFQSHISPRSPAATSNEKKSYHQNNINTHTMRSSVTSAVLFCCDMLRFTEIDATFLLMSSAYEMVMIIYERAQFTKPPSFHHL